MAPPENHLISLARAVATLGPVGFIRRGPGTWGSLAGLLILLIFRSDSSHQMIAAAFVILVAFWSAGKAARSMQDKDPGPVIIDEVAGVMVALAGVPVTWMNYAAGFLLFRLLDILKPFPIRRIERLGGSLGIVGDDLLAGAGARLILLLM